MWHTQEGDRVLTGDEGKLFLASLRFMVDILEDDDLEDAWAFRVEVFDRLTVGQKLTMLRDVARALLDPTEPMPELSAVNEGTVAAVYQNLLDNTLMEVDEDDETQVDQSFRYYWRSLIMAAVKEAEQAENVSPDPEWNPTIESNAMGDWDTLVAYLENRILWDDGDWDLEEEIADSSPELAQHQKEVLGITDDYFLAVAPDPPESEIPKLIDEIRELCGPDTA
jgi:hypothetical protein